MFEMKKIILYIFLLCVSFISCVSTPANNSSYSSGSYNSETSNVRATPSVPSIPQKTETEVVFTFNGPEGVNARLYYNGQLIGEIATEKTVGKTIPDNGVFTFKAQIGDETEELSLASRSSTTINVNISARRTTSGIAFTDFSLVNRIPSIVRYVKVDGLNVRNNTNADAAKLDVIPQDCKIEILEEYTNKWVRVKYNGNKTGYVNGTLGLSRAGRQKVKP
jgi:uncharacterized protein YgiM (DUF1202 family)